MGINLLLLLMIFFSSIQLNLIMTPPIREYMCVVGSFCFCVKQYVTFLALRFVLDWISITLPSNSQ